VDTSLFQRGVNGTLSDNHKTRRIMS